MLFKKNLCKCIRVDRPCDIVLARMKKSLKNIGMHHFNLIYATAVIVHVFL